MKMSMLVALTIGALSSSTFAGSMPDPRMPLLVPKTNHEPLRASVYDLFPRAEGRWGAIHIVDRTCSISLAVVAHLLERRASTDIDELVIVIDRDGATRREDIELVHAGFRVRVVPRDRARELVPLAAQNAFGPSMIVARPDGSLAYVGGHRTSTKPSAGAERSHRGAVGRTDANLDAAAVADAVANVRDDTIADADGFVDARVFTDLVANGSTSITTPVVGCSARP